MQNSISFCQHKFWKLNGVYKGPNYLCLLKSAFAFIRCCGTKLSVKTLLSQEEMLYLMYGFNLYFLKKYFYSVNNSPTFP
jgi:hypothetical protein